MKARLGAVLQECFDRIPYTAKEIDYEKASRYPTLFIFKQPFDAVLERAVKARREGAGSRATAIEWAYDSLLALSGYVRVGEVYPIVDNEWDYDEKGEHIIVTRKKWAALVQERDELA